MKTLFLATALSLLPACWAMAKDELTKVELKEQAVKMCFSAAEQHYGDGVIRSGLEQAKYHREISRARWNRSLKGMTVKMTIKPASERHSVVKCLVKADKTVTFSGV